MNSLGPDETGAAVGGVDTPLPGRPRQVALVVFGVLAVALGVGLARRFMHDAALRAEVENAADDRVPVLVRAPRRAPASIDTVLPGSVEALQETTLYARVSGYVKRWLVDIGDEVKEGQLLAEIDTPELEEQLAQARAGLAQAKAGLVQAKANQELAQVTANRYEKLTPAGVTSQQDVDDKRAGLDVAKANVLAAEAAIKSGEANVQRLVDLKAFARVIAPFDGIVTSRPTEVGQMVTASTGQGQAMFRVAKVDPVRVFLRVPQSAAPSIRVGQETRLTVREYPGRTFVGRVTRMAKALDSSTRTMLTEVQVANADRALMPGMYAQANIPTASIQNALLVPSTALIVNADGTQVAIAVNGTAHLQNVVVEADYGTEIAITEGLKGDEKVVANPGERLVEGVKLAVNESPEGGKAK